MVRLKEGVRVEGVRPETVLAILIAIPIFGKYGSPLVITSLVDGKHSPTSRHYVGLAVDFRIWYIETHEQQVTQELQKALGADYSVRLEEDHIHVSFKPRR
jgi:hypothetical protein